MKGNAKKGSVKKVEKQLIDLPPAEGGVLSSPRQRQIISRLDQALPLETEEYRRVEQLLAYLTEFAPVELVDELAGAVVFYADDQARRGYALGQEDLIIELNKRVAVA